MSLSCKDVKRALGGSEPLEDDRFDDAALEAHLVNCVACRLVDDGFARLDALLAVESAAPEPVVPESVMASVRAELTARQLREARWSRVWSPLTVAAAVLVCCALLALAEAGDWRTTVETTATAAGLVGLPELDLGLAEWTALAPPVPVPSLALLLLGVVGALALNLVLCRGPRLSKETR